MISPHPNNSYAEDRRASVWSVGSSSTWNDNRLNNTAPASTLALGGDQATDGSSSTVQSVSGLQLDIYPDRQFFVAPGIVSGLLKVAVTSKMRIRTISIEIEGYEQAEDRLVFLRRYMALQGGDLPPSEAVDPAMPDASGYYLACKKETFFPFGIEVPQAPCSWSSKRCSVGFVLRCIVEVKVGSRVRNVICERATQLFETPRVPLALAPSGASAGGEWGMFGGRGKVDVYCDMERSKVIAGGFAYVNVRVTNFSTKRISEISVKLVQRVKTFKCGEGGKSFPLSFERFPITKTRFDRGDFNFEALEGRPISLAILIPNDLYDIRFLRLVEVTHALIIEAKASFSKAILVNLPINIYHAATIARPSRLPMDHVVHFMPMMKEIYLPTNTNKQDYMTLGRRNDSDVDESADILPEAINTTLQQGADKNSSENEEVSETDVVDLAKPIIDSAFVSTSDMYAEETPDVEKEVAELSTLIQQTENFYPRDEDDQSEDEGLPGPNYIAMMNRELEVSKDNFVDAPDHMSIQAATSPPPPPHPKHDRVAFRQSPPAIIPTQEAEAEKHDDALDDMFKEVLAHDETVI